MRTELTELHRSRISDSMIGNTNQLGKNWSWSQKSKDKRKMQFVGKTWSPKTSFKKGYTPWNKGGKMPESMGVKMQAIASMRIGELGANWIDGRSFIPYSVEFNNSLKRRIRERDNFTCLGCGIKEPAIDEKLSVHHMDYNKMNCAISNLVTVCRSCNSIANSKDYRSGKLNIVKTLD